ncbi:CPBP family intramembrane glutamic endopeptidase [Thalassoroseus pseudoceratinae]|uniref:CPBP family intramembrane glutamic endopeptidase n=1 Tax=Thalassoroseus pseudoceratinae TaxID=2713176 RepID=UPI00141EE38E|nr:CPBP family intramembrane glutamic endopeptidase [Thalassoroseus pseudoceratinae]
MPESNPIPWPLMIGMGVMMLASLSILLAWQSGRWRDAASAIRPTDPTPANGWAVAIVLFFAAQSLLVQLPIVERTPQTAITIHRVQQLVYFSLAQWVALLVTLRWTGGSERWAAWGIHRRELGRQFFAGGLGAVASLLPVYAALMLTAPFRNAENQHVLLQLMETNSDGTTILWIALAVMVTAPMVEELMYRVILQSSLECWWNRRVAWIGTAVLFSAVHGLPDAIPLLPLALILGFVFQQTRSYLAVVVLHALFNGWNLFWALMKAS